MFTLDQLTDRHNVTVDPHLNREALVPVSGGVQRQGDVLILPRPVTAATPVPREGVPVVRGEAGGNTHLLLADGPARFDRVDRGLVVGHLQVAEGAVAYLAHPEHGFAGVAPGSYEVRRQREQADIVRVVAD